MSLQQSLFRKIALERLSSPERLDTLPEAVTVPGWMALAALGALLGGALLWGWFGEIATSVEGRCVLQDPAGARGAGLEAVVYIPANDGGRIRPGMQARIVPVTARREENGFMLASVNRVGGDAAPPGAVMAGAGLPLVVRARVARDGAGRHLWSLPAGAQHEVRAGTLCRAEVIVERQRPLALVLPTLKRTLALD